MSVHRIVGWPRPRWRIPRRARRVLGALAAAALAGSGLSSCGDQTSSALPAVQAYLGDWARADWTAMLALIDKPPANFATTSAAALTALDVKSADYEPGRLVTDGSTASVPVAEHLRLAGIGVITLETVLRLRERSSRWLVEWSPATIEPALRAGRQLLLQITWPARAPILGAEGVPLTAESQMVVIGVEGSYVKDQASLIAALVQSGATLDETTRALALAKVHPSYFEPVFQVTRPRYEQLKARLYPLPGTVFDATTARTAITTGLEAHVVGSVGPITAQELQALGAPYDATSMVGQTGLEQVYERQLAGTPGATVSVVDAAGTPLKIVASLAAKPGRPLRTTIEPSVQRAAEGALSSVAKPAALVALDTTSGAVLASVSDPASVGYDLALDGTFPPGSTFKMVTAAALIEDGLGPTSAASCPPSLTVGGEVFHNAEGELPVKDLLHAFAESCNTAFIQLATANLGASAFSRTAAQFDLGRSPEMGLPAFAGSVPTPTDAEDLAATAIGQGRVLVSPLDMAVIAAAVGSGKVRPPRLVAGSADDHAQETALPPKVVADLRQMMAAVVATGTAAHQGLPSGTYAKTGTAEYGSGNSLPTDAWLIGFDGTVAFAIVVVGGGEGGPTDGPIAAKFLSSIATR